LKLICICTTPRSGSELFCRALREGGLRHVYEIGHPFYRDELSKQYGAEFSNASNTTILNHLRSVEPALGHVAVKIFYHEMQEIASTQPLDECVFIHLERRDLASQVVSLLAMWATGRAVDLPVNTVPFDTTEPTERNAKIAIAYLRSNRRAWRNFLSAYPLIGLTTEDIIADPANRFADLSRFLAPHDVPLDAAAASAVVQASKRYEQDAALKTQIRDRFKTLLSSLD